MFQSPKKMLSKLLLGLLFLSSFAWGQDRLTLAEEAYKAGTFLSHKEDYKHLYSVTKDRNIKLTLVRKEGSSDITTYKYKVDGREGEGVLVIDYVQDIPQEAHEYPAPKKALVDTALAGQGADFVTTAIGVGSGLAVEANPIMAPLTSGTGWLLMAGLKSGAALAGDSKPFAECVAWRSTLSKLGWSAAVWNIAGTLINPVVGLGAAAGTWFLSSESVDADAVARCLEVR